MGYINGGFNDRDGAENKRGISYLSLSLSPSLSLSSPFPAHVVSCLFFSLMMIVAECRYDIYMRFI